MGYCPAAEVRLADERVIVPVRREGPLIGWLAAVRTGNRFQFWTAPGMHGGQHLYNLDRAKQYPTGLVVPSPEWVWRVGTAAVAPLSFANPERIAQRLRHAFADKPLILVSPPGHYDQMASLIPELLTRHSAKFTHIRLSESTTRTKRKDLKQMIQDAAARKGIALSFSKQA